MNPPEPVNPPGLNPPDLNPPGLGRSPILEVGVRAVFHTVLLFSLFLLFVGHNSPGGGFVGGLVAGCAFVLRYASGGSDELREAVPVRPQVLLGLGLLAATAAGASGWIGGRQFLESAELSLDLPLIGGVHATTALPFDIGVYLVVTGLVLGLLHALGGEPEPEPGAATGDVDA